jgi:hypothetical protein
MVVDPYQDRIDFDELLGNRIVPIFTDMEHPYNSLDIIGLERWS